jgi:hypothetical protein
MKVIYEIHYRGKFGCEVFTRVSKIPFLPPAHFKIFFGEQPFCVSEICTEIEDDIANPIEFPGTTWHYRKRKGKSGLLLVELKDFSEDELIETPMSYKELEKIMKNNGWRF